MAPRKLRNSKFRAFRPRVGHTSGAFVGGLSHRIGGKVFHERGAHNPAIAALLYDDRKALAGRSALAERQVEGDGLAFPESDRSDLANDVPIGKRAAAILAVADADCDLRQNSKHPDRRVRFATI